MKAKAIVRDIGVFEDWLTDGVNVYKASDIDDFEDKIRKVINNELPDLTQEGYKVAQEHDIKKVGKELIDIYKEVLEENR